jgi:hypothetical protein
MKQGVLDEDLLRSALYGLALSSARAQEEYALVRDASLPNLWTVAVPPFLSVFITSPHVICFFGIPANLYQRFY